MPLPKEQTYTIEDIYKLPDGVRAELIDGEIYYMAPPSRRFGKAVGCSASAHHAGYFERLHQRQHRTGKGGRLFS